MALTHYIQWEGKTDVWQKPGEASVGFRAKFDSTGQAQMGHKEAGARCQQDYKHHTMSFSLSDLNHAVFVSCLFLTPGREKCLVWVIWTTTVAGAKRSWIFTLRRASLCLQLNQHLDVAQIATTQWFPLAGPPVSGPTISTSQLTADSAQHASILPTCQPCAPYKAVQQEENYHNVVICFPCEGVIGFLPP